MLLASLRRAGAARPGDCDSETWTAAVVAELIDWAMPFEVGVVLERRAATVRAPHPAKVRVCHGTRPTVHPGGMARGLDNGGWPIARKRRR
jgi:hypothetical protein